ncbi:MAG: hypothetical protein E7481_08625 [Ruminococcaceae bacterium]|nr:hypothetical protein [Oscillospiraceae bacterium]
MEFEVTVRQLSPSFMADYPESLYPELMHKQGRPYSCLLVESHDYTICIPFRSSIPHKNAFLFRGTKRSSETRSGLDYTKIVLIKKEEYFDDSKAVVDQDEYNEAMKNIDIIVSEVLEYINSYIIHIRGEKILHKREFDRKYLYSTLVYFHDILGLSE